MQNMREKKLIPQAPHNKNKGMMISIKPAPGSPTVSMMPSTKCISTIMYR